METCEYCDKKAIGYERVYGTPEDIQVCSECAHVNATVHLYDGGTHCKRSAKREGAS